MEKRWTNSWNGKYVNVPVGDGMFQNFFTFGLSSDENNFFVFVCEIFEQ